MEKKLLRLFDFQKYEGNRSLGQVIDEVHARYASRELEMDEMETVNAAGMRNPGKPGATGIETAGKRPGRSDDRGPDLRGNLP